MSDSRSRSIRWWPAAGIVLLAVVGLLVVWLRPADSRQNQVTATMAIAFLTVVALFVWLLLLSRMRWTRRLLAALVLVVVAVAAGYSVRVRGFSGDIVPIFEWRWTSPAKLPGAPPERTGAPSDAVPVVLVDDYPQFLGPARTGVVPEIRFGLDWPEEPPRVLWRQPIGAGWSAFAVVGDFAVTQEQRADEEWVSCYDPETGVLLWAHVDDVRFQDPVAGPGPRATPTIADGRVYALGGSGILNTLDLTTGRKIWTVDIAEDNGASIPTYGYAGSPLVLEDAVVVVAGGPDSASLVAYDRDTGQRLWSGGGDPTGYSSPIVATLGGVRQIVVFNNRNLTAHDANDGAVLWAYAWPSGSEHVSQPVVLPDDRLFLSTGYGVGGKLFRIDRDAGGEWGVELLWESRGLKAKLTDVVHRDGFLYGLDDGILVCLDVATGERRWKRGRYGHGQVILAGDVLVIQAENGDVALARATPDEYREIARIPVLDSKTWNHAALAGRRLMVRNDRQAACLELPPHEDGDGRGR